ncbi:MAG TPA: hypothetical protein VFS88_00255 [Micavibrio sp.]|nr:hypothetical protein [Micavibrio sp.]
MAKPKKLKSPTKKVKKLKSPTKKVNKPAAKKAAARKTPAKAKKAHVERGGHFEASTGFRTVNGRRIALSDGNSA